MAGETMVASDNISRLINQGLTDEIEKAIENELPRIVAAACAKVAIDIQSVFSVQRLGTDLVVTIRNAYK